MENLEEAIKILHKKYGKECIFQIKSIPEEIEVIRTGSFLLDKALGVGGYPRGRVVEIYGPEGSGKTTLALHAIAEVQKSGGKAAFIDAEHAVDLKYAESIGVDVGEMFISQPNCGEEALEIADTLARSNDLDLIVIDSVAALTPRAEIEGEMGQSHMGLQARLMSQALRKLNGIVAKSNCIIIFINQIRMKIGVIFGSPETTTGGRALKFYASVRLDIRAREKIIKKEEVIGNNVHIKVVKNKVAPPFKEIDTCIMFGVGIFKEGELLETAITNDVVEKSGAWFKYKEEKIQGRDKMLQYIKEHLNEFEEQK